MSAKSRTRRSIRFAIRGVPRERDAISSAPCYNALQAGDLAGCKTKYVRMVRDLEREYLS